MELRLKVIVSRRQLMRMNIIIVIKRRGTHDRGLTEFRMLLDMKDIISTIETSLACFRFFGSIQEVRSWIGDWVDLLQRETLTHRSLMMMILHHAFTNALLIKLFKRKIDVLHLLFLIKMHIVRNKFHINVLTFHSRTILVAECPLAQITLLLSALSKSWGVRFALLKDWDHSR